MHFFSSYFRPITIPLSPPQELNRYLDGLSEHYDIPKVRHGTPNSVATHDSVAVTCIPSCITHRSLFYNIMHNPLSVSRPQPLVYIPSCITNCSPFYHIMYNTLSLSRPQPLYTYHHALYTIMGYTPQPIFIAPCITHYLCLCQRFLLSLVCVLRRRPVSTPYNTVVLKTNFPLPSYQCFSCIYLRANLRIPSRYCTCSILAVHFSFSLTSFLSFFDPLSLFFPFIF